MIRADTPAPRLTSFAERINRLLDEKQGIAGDIADVYLEAKSAGYVPKVLRKVITRGRMDQTKLAEEEGLQALYEAAMGEVGKALADVRSGATWDYAGREHGISRATLARAAAVSKRREVIPERVAGRPDSNRDRGEHLPVSEPAKAPNPPQCQRDNTTTTDESHALSQETSNDADGRSDDAIRMPEVDAGPHVGSRGGGEGRAETVRLRVGPGPDADEREGARGAQGNACAGCAEAEAPVAQEVGAGETRPKGTSIPADGDDLLIPAFLRRTA